MPAVQASARSALLVVVVAALAGSCGRDTPRAPAAFEGELPTPVAAERARVGRMRVVIRASGTVTADSGAEFLVLAPEPARILDILPAEGDLVAGGDPLVRFDVPAAQAEADRRRADEAMAQSRVESARIGAERARELFARGIISRQEMEGADRELGATQADAARAEGARAAADAAVGRALVRAPFAGVIAQRFHEPGDVVQGAATDPILRLVDPARLQVLAAVPVAEASRVLPGAEARVTSIAGAAIRLVVMSRPTVQPGAAGEEAIVRLTFVETAPLPVDERVDVEIDGEEHENAVLIPIDALIRDGDGPAVMVVAGDIAERRSVATGLADGQHVEITSGIRAGELVITRGHIGLAHGAPISAAISQP